MPTSATFAVQNWVITPAARAVDEIQPSSILGQSWLMVLTGVVIVDLQGRLPNGWLRDTIVIFPDIIAPIEWAAARWLIPLPQKPGWVPVFSLEQWAPFAAVSAAFNNSPGSVELGLSVDVWRLSQLIQTYKRIRTMSRSQTFSQASRLTLEC